MSVASFALDPRDGRVVVVFGDAQGRHLPLWVDDGDAAALGAACRAPVTAPDPGRSAPALVLAVVEACGGGVDRAELRRLERGILQGVIVVDGAQGPSELPAKASTAAAVALLAGAPLLVDEVILAYVDARVREAAARAERSPPVGGGSDEPVAQSSAERWSQTLQHLAEKLLDEQRS